MLPVYSQYLDVHPTVWSVRDKAVGRVRLISHDLNARDEDCQTPYGDRSNENHISIYLLLGNDTIVSVDMKSHRGDAGRMLANATVGMIPDSCMEYYDLEVVRSPANFTPGTKGEESDGDDDRWDGYPSWYGPSVIDFLEAITDQDLHLFTFANHDGNLVSCRSWV